MAFMKSSEETGDRIFPSELTVRCLTPSPSGAAAAQSRRGQAA